MAIIPQLKLFDSSLTRLITEKPKTTTCESAGHESNLDCFIHAIHPDGSVVWDDHGTRCGVCLQIAAESIKMQREGKAVKEFRAYIDEKYREGYAKPTPTPMPSKNKRYGHKLYGSCAGSKIAGWD